MTDSNSLGESSSSSYQETTKRGRQRTGEGYHQVDSQESGDVEYDDNLHRHRAPRSCAGVLLALCTLLVGVLVAVVAYQYNYSGFSDLADATAEGSESWEKSADRLRQTSSLDGLRNAAVAADHPLCSKVGADILKNEGGNAVDAAIATLFCLGVANPSSSGLGGGAFMLIHMDRDHFRRRYDERKTGGPSQEFEDRRTDGDDAAQASKSSKNNPMITEVIDCRESAPAAATEDMFVREGADVSSSFGGLSIAVPGELRGLALAHERHGSLPWDRLVRPAWLMAQNGVSITAHMAHDIRKASKIAQERHRDHNENYDALRDILTRSGDWNDLLGIGDVIRNPNLADTLYDIMQNGADALYNSNRTRMIVEDIQDAGGILTVGDFHRFRPVVRTPVVSRVSGHTVVGVPPPSSGGAVIIGMLRFLQGYESPLSSFPRTLSIHRIVEAMRHGFAMRMSLSDMKEPTERVVLDLTKGTYMDSLRNMTSDDSVLPISQYGGPIWAQLHDSDGNSSGAQDAHEGDRRLRKRRERRRLANTFGYLEDNGTTHLSVVDKSGNAVAVTSSINGVFGSYVLSRSTGILLGDTMDDFGNPGKPNFYGLRPSPENFIAPGKRPLSSMSPTMVFWHGKEVNSNAHERVEDDASLSSKSWGELRLVVGGSGGPKIITSVVQVIINYCLLGMPLFHAVVRPRVHDQLLYHSHAVTTVENSTVGDAGNVRLAFPEESRLGLLRRGHESLIEIDYAGTVQAIAFDMESGNISAMCDVRKGGEPSGY